MTGIVTEALPLWDMEGATAQLIAARENQVFRVDHRGASFALRLHRPGYRSNAELTSELAWMDVAAKGGIIVPAPLASKSGQFLHVVQDVQVDVLGWLPGTPMPAPGCSEDAGRLRELFHKLGRQMARLHQVSDAWARPADFTRCRWDRNGLLGDTPLWDRFWDNPGLSREDRALFLDFRATADAHLAAREDCLDYGLIHADLVRANVIVDRDQVALIDFDDGGFGFRLFEIATALLKTMSEPDYPGRRDALLTGYRSIRAIDTEMLDLFLALRATTYVGWKITRMKEDGAAGRNERFISTAMHLARRYLDPAA